MQKKVKAPARGAPQQTAIQKSVADVGAPTAGTPTAATVQSYPILEVFRRLSVKVTKGYELVDSGELETFMIGRYRYATEEALRRFIEKRLDEARNESAAKRADKVKAAVKGRARQRDQRATA